MTPETRAIRLIEVPYQLGNHLYNEGNGPPRILQAGAVAALEAAGRPVEKVTIRLPDDVVNHPATSEVGRVFATARLLAMMTRDTVLAGQTPVVLSGGCTSCWGTISGIGATGTGIVWLDAHGDLNTPSTSPGGFLDGMALGTATGRGWETVCRTIPGYGPVPLDRVLLVGVHQLDPPEEELLTREPVLRSNGTELQDVAAKVGELAGRLGVGGGVYLHIDLDVLDTSVGKANAYSAPGGLTTRQVVEVIEAVGSSTTIRAAALTALNPNDDLSGGIADAAVEILGAIGRAVA